MIQSNPLFGNSKMNSDFPPTRPDVPSGNPLLNGHQVETGNRGATANEQFEFKLMTPDNRLITVPFYREETIGILKVK